MAGLRFAALQSRPIEFLDLTSVTLEEFQRLVPPFEAAFHARMAAWRMDGKLRTTRRFPVYKNSSVAKFDFGGKIQKLCIRNSMSYRLANSRKSNFATEPEKERQETRAPHQFFKPARERDDARNWCSSMPLRDAIYTRARLCLIMGMLLVIDLF